MAAVCTAIRLEQDLATQATWDLPGYNASEFYLDRARQNPSSPPTSLPMMAPRGVQVHGASAFMRKQAPREEEPAVDRAADAPPKNPAAAEASVSDPAPAETPRDEVPPEDLQAQPES